MNDFKEPFPLVLTPPAELAPETTAIVDRAELAAMGLEDEAEKAADQTADTLTHADGSTQTVYTTEQLEDIVRHGSPEEQKQERGEITADGMEWDNLDAPDLPFFPYECIPQKWAGLSANLAGNYPCAREYVICTELATISHCLAGTVKTIYNEKEQPGWAWFGLVGKPGTKKSSAIGVLTAGIVKRNNDSREKIEPLVKKALERLKLLNRLKAAAQYKAIGDQIEQMQQIQDFFDRQAVPLDEKSIQIIDQQINMLNVPQYPFTCFNDTTPEKLIRQVAHSHGRCMINTDQGMMVEIITGGASFMSGAANIDILIALYEGTPYKYDRVSTETIDLKSPGGSFLIGMQPLVLRKLFGSKDATGKGLSQRFFMFEGNQAEALSGEAVLNRCKLDKQLLNEWQEYTGNLFDMMQTTHTDGYRICPMDSAAHEAILKAEAMWNQRAIPLDAGDSPMADCYRKAVGSACRLSVILAFMRDSKTQSVTLSDAQNAIRILDEYCLPMMARYIDGSRTVLSGAELAIVSMLRAIKDKNPDFQYFAQNELWQSKAKSYPVFAANGGNNKYKNTLVQLAKHGYIKKAIPDPAAKRRQPEGWYINPSLWNLPRPEIKRTRTKKKP